MICNNFKIPSTFSRADLEDLLKGKFRFVRVKCIDCGVTFELKNPNCGGVTVPNVAGELDILKQETIELKEKVSDLEETISNLRDKVISLEDQLQQWIDEEETDEV